MITLFDNDNDKRLGTITESQLAFLIRQLQEESAEDQDYYINRPTLEMFAGRGADPDLLDLLRASLGDRDDMEIRWTRG